MHALRTVLAVFPGTSTIQIRDRDLLREQYASVLGGAPQVTFLRIVVYID